MNYSIEHISYEKMNDNIRLYFTMNESSHASCVYNQEQYLDIGNISEPYNFKQHVFDLPYQLEYNLILNIEDNNRQILQMISTKFYIKDISNQINQVYHYHDFRVIDSTNIHEGFYYEHIFCKTIDELPVHLYNMIIDPKTFDIVASTAHLENRFIPYNIDTIMNMSNEYQSITNKKVYGAINGDFYDMNGNCMSSGPCIVNGSELECHDINRLYFGVTKENKIVISDNNTIPISQIFNCVSGNPQLIKNGEIYDTCAHEEFGTIAHPRTAIGILGNGDILVTVVDGRRKEWSNGASLYDLATYMKSKGAYSALNLDGGGSSTFIISIGSTLTMQNKPADLFKPDLDLIRPVANGLLFVLKE